MNQALSLTLLAVGVVLVIYGINSSESFSSEMSDVFTGSPSNKTLWLLVGGSICAAAGLSTLFLWRKPAK